MESSQIWLEFVIDLANALSMPLTAGVIAATILMFRRPLSALIGRIINVKVPGVFEATAEPHRELLEARREAQSLSRSEPVQPTSDAEPSVAGPRSYRESFAEIDEVSPQVAIYRAWDLVEKCIFSAADHIENSSTQIPKRTFPEAARVLANNRLFDARSLSIVMKMHDLRNTAMHSSEFTPNMGFALDFADVSEAIIAHVQAQVPAMTSP